MKNLFLIFLLTSCANSKALINKNLIIGSWCLPKDKLKEINYGRIDLSKDSVIVMRSRADTIYSFKFIVSENELLIVKSPTDTVKNHILKMTPDSLVLSSLMEKSSKQVYYRCK